ncbi:MAG TPA: PQQ-dependent sugar dehydrogenase [Burkholderiales bacterium]|nr:PQQ-dependent sugar dehydrogenase [Burkholderiales bacterium]
MADLRQLPWRVFALAALVLAACGGGSDGGTQQPAAPAPPVTFTVQRVFPGLSFTSPVAMLQAPGDNARWFVVEQSGRVLVFVNNPAVAATAVFVDITGRVTSGGETGLLGMAFHPNFPTDRRVFLSYTATSGNLVSRISSFMTTDGGQTLDPASERILITLNQPEDNHNGGNIAFGPDRLLYIGFGDGGGGNDQHGTIGNAQLLTTLLGKMLRIDVGAEAATTYTIPSTNPFAANPKCGPGTNTQSCPEIYAYGFRNPWRWSFDRLTGQLWVGDVGQGEIEEVDRVTLGGNYGWRCFEGTRNTGFACGSPPNLLPPVAEYGRSVGHSITGGHVYRGSMIAPLVGRYVFGDFITHGIFNIAESTQPTLTVRGGFDSGLSISSFGEGNDDELYVVDYSGGLYRISQ